jgi:general secretion pathway protein A
MRVLAERLSRLADLSVGVIHHPQSNLSDFYRKLGDIFSIAIRISNRWGGFKALRARWLDHLSSINRRPVILIDEAQEMSPVVLCELRLLAQARFDSQSLLRVILAGDARLLDKLRREELIPLGSRMHTRLATEAATREELLACLEHSLTAAGNPTLMTKELRHTLCDHAAGNYRIFTAMAAELLMSAAQRDLPVLDEKLYLQVFARPETQSARRSATR